MEVHSTISFNVASLLLPLCKLMNQFFIYQEHENSILDGGQSQIFFSKLMFSGVDHISIFLIVRDEHLHIRESERPKWKAVN
jgi:hypothetical protein